MSHPFFSAEPRFHHDLVEITESKYVKIDLRYCGSNNFMKRDLYQGFNQAFLHELAFVKFSRAVKILEAQFSDLNFLIYDALRPRSVQQLMYNFVYQTPMQNYVANPKLGSMHNFGMALDLTLQDKTGTVLDMGTDFDDFTELAQPKLERQLLASSKLSSKQVENRKTLRSIMEDSGFEQLPHEWWHYNALPVDKVRKEFIIIK